MYLYKPGLEWQWESVLTTIRLKGRREWKLKKRTNLKYRVLQKNTLK